MFHYGVLLGLVTLQSNGKVSTIRLNAVEVTLFFQTSVFVQSFVNHQAKKAGIEKLVKSMEHKNITVKPKSKRHGNAFESVLWCSFIIELGK